MDRKDHVAGQHKRVYPLVGKGRVGRGSPNGAAQRVVPRHQRAPLEQDLACG